MAIKLQSYASLRQDRLLYMPAKAGVERMASGGLRAWPSPQDFRGLVAEPTGAVRGMVIVFHGNAGPATVSSMPPRSRSSGSG